MPGDKEIRFTLTVKDDGTATIERFAKGFDKSSKHINSSDKALKGWRREAEQASKSARGLSMAMGSLGKQITALVSIAGAIMAFRKLKSELTDMISLANDYERQCSKLETLVRSTGGAAGFTARELMDMAGAFEAASIYGDDMVANAEAIILTFKEIRGDVFKETMGYVLDLATVMGTDLRSAAVQLGKALNAPVQNLGALSRAGIQFTDQQKDMIKTLWEAGRHLEAQRLILDELASEFGGTAAAQVEVFGGAWARMTNYFNDFKRELGFVVTTSPEAIAAVNELKDTFIEWGKYLKDHREELQKVINVYIQKFVKGVKELPSILDKVKKHLDEVYPTLKLIGELAKAAGAGLITKILFGPTAGAVVGTLVLLNEQLKKFNLNLGNIDDSSRDAAGAFQNILDVLTGKRDWKTGEWLVSHATNATNAIKVDRKKYLEWLKASEKESVSKSGKSEGTALPKVDTSKFKDVLSDLQFEIDLLKESETIQRAMSLARQNDIEIGSEQYNQILKLVEAHKALKDTLSVEAEIEKKHQEALKESSLLELDKALANAPWEEGTEKAEETFKGLTELSERTANAMEQNFSNLFFDVMTNKFTSFKDFADGIFNSISRVMSDMLGQLAREAIFGPATAGGGAVGGGWMTNLIKMLPGVGAAHGLAFAGPGIGTFENSIVSKPTIFPFAKGIGLMGEGTRPEAVIPLTRTKTGDLGVKMEGAAGISNTFNINIAGTGRQYFKAVIETTKS